jgi:hypothetical protein
MVHGAPEVIGGGLWDPEEGNATLGLADGALEGWVESDHWMLPPRKPMPAASHWQSTQIPASRSISSVMASPQAQISGGDGRKGVKIARVGAMVQTWKFINSSS